MCNASFQQMKLPEHNKKAIVRPLLKKQTLDPNDPNSYHPISSPFTPPIPPLLPPQPSIFSQRAATWRRQRGWLMVYRPSFSFFLFFYSGTDLSRYLSDRRIFFTDTRVMTLGCKRRSWISNILLTYFTGWNKPLKMPFFTCFLLGDLTFSIAARKQMYHLRWIIFHPIHQRLL